MRQIKFRAWDAARERMSSSPKWVEFQINVNGILSAKNIKPAYRGKGYQQLVIMEYVGLQDKKGVDIYEGDILVDYAHHREKGKISLYYIVEYSENKFTTRRIDGNIKCEAFSSTRIAGNIYQNPELLNINTEEDSNERG